MPQRELQAELHIRPRPLQNYVLVEYLDEIGSQIGGGEISSRLHAVQCGA